MRIRYFILACYLVAASGTLLAQKAKKEFYELRIYKVKEKAQEEMVDTFLKDALLPGLHGAGVKKVGVFKPLQADSLYGKRIYVLIPHATFDDYLLKSQILDGDRQLEGFGKNYAEAPYTAPAYSRFETILLRAFPGMPAMKAPSFSNPASERVYELRSYESASEKIYRNKVQMFNEGGEIGIFERLGFNAVFYADVIVGGKMPNLMYLTTFENRASRDEHWKTFGTDPAWVKLKGMPEYQHNVSKAEIMLLRPADYSDY